MSLVLFFLLVDIRATLKSRLVRARYWLSLLALQAQGALPRAEPKTFSQAFLEHYYGKRATARGSGGNPRVVNCDDASRL